MTAPNLPNVVELPNNIRMANTHAGPILFNCPPETIKLLLSRNLPIPQTVLLPPDIRPGAEVGSSGFVRRGVNYASVEFVLFHNYFKCGGRRTQLVTHTEDQARRLQAILRETFSGPADLGRYSWLRQECREFQYHPPLGRHLTVDDLAEVTSLEAHNGSLSLQPSASYTGATATVHVEGNRYVICDSGGKQDQFVEVSVLANDPAHPPEAAILARSTRRAQITIQWVGSSDGFDPAGVTTCFLAMFGASPTPRPTLFDAAAYLTDRLAALGISPAQISELVLTHVHEDHLAGLPELLLLGQRRLRLITAPIIYQGLLRILAAMLAVSEAEVAALIDYYPLEPGRPLVLDGKHFEAIFSIHVIPTLAVRVEGLCYSGDMRYDEAWFDDLVARGVITPQRQAELLGFAQGADVLIQDAGGPGMHTELSPAVIAALSGKSKRILFVHSRRRDRPPGMGSSLEFAETGHVTTLGPVVPRRPIAEYAQTLGLCPLLDDTRVPSTIRVALAMTASVLQYLGGAVILDQGEPPNGLIYVVHEGVVEIWENDRERPVLGRGACFGEQAVLLGRPRSATAIARTDVTLLALPGEAFQDAAGPLDLAAALKRAERLAEWITFQHLPYPVRLDLATDFQPEHFLAGESIIRYGEQGNDCFLLVSGALRVLDALGRKVDRMTMPGDFFGARAPVSGQRSGRRNATVMAEVASEVWRLPGPALERQLARNPNLLLHLLTVERDRLGVPHS